MLAAVHFNDKVRVATGEIRIIRSDRQLSHKLVPVKATSTKFRPKFLLGFILNLA